MAQTQFRGSTQIQPGTVTLDRLVNGYQIPTANLVDGANFVKKDGSVAFTAAVNFGGFAPTNGATPVNASDLVIKSYVDGLVNGLTFHPFSRVVSTSNISTLSGLLTVDGVTVAAGDRVLLVAQTTGSQNGPWVAASGSWSRPSDWPGGATVKEGAYFMVDPDGTNYKNTKWFCTNTGTITVDTTNTTFSQDLSGTIYSNGNGISLTGTVFAVKSGNGIAFDGSNNVTVSPDATRGIQTTASGVGVIDGTAGQIAIANASNHFSWATMSGDITITSSGATTVSSTSGSGFLKYTNVIINETPGGSVNGTNTAFTTANVPYGLQVFVNGMLQEAGSGNDYTVSGNAITMLYAPTSGDKVRVTYFR